MSHWHGQTIDGAEFWITCKWLAFLSSFSHLQVIQNKGPWCSAPAYAVQISAAINNKITLVIETKKQNTSTYFFLSNYMVPHSSQETFTNHKFCWCVVLLTERQFCFQLLLFFILSLAKPLHNKTSFLGKEGSAEENKKKLGFLFLVVFTQFFNGKLSRQHSVELEALARLLSSTQSPTVQVLSFLSQLLPSFSELRCLLFESFLEVFGFLLGSHLR